MLSQTVNTGMLYVSENTKFSSVSSFNNKPEATFYNDGRTSLYADIYNEGLYLTGGGSMLRGLDKRISRKTKLPVYVAEDPLRAVARGTGIALKNTENYTFLIQ